MSKLVAIESQSGVPVLKVMADADDDPVTTSDTDYEKFLFNSNNAKLGYLYETREAFYSDWPIPGSTNQTTKWFYPQGSDASTAAEQVISKNGGGTPDTVTFKLYFSTYFAFDYVPIVEYRSIDPSNDRFNGPSGGYHQTGHQSGANNGEVGYIGGNAGYDGSSSRLDENGLSTRHHANIMLIEGSLLDVVISSWELPAMNETFPDYSGPSSNLGDVVCEISPARTRLAYPGRVVTDTNPSHFVFHEDRIPGKVLACGEVSIATGANVTIATKLPTSKTTYMDYIVRKSDDPDFYQPPRIPSGAKEDSTRLQYEVLSQSVKLYNLSSFAIVVRYMVLANDGGAQSTGGSQVTIRANDGVQDYFRIKVPGSSDIAPQLNDIILDTRLAYIPLVDEGYLAVADFTETTDDVRFGEGRKTINFTNNGFMPFVKHTTVYADTYAAPRCRLLKAYFAGSVGSFWTDHCSGDTVNCRVKDTTLQFYMSPYNPTVLAINGSNATVEVHQAKPVGVRWYLFAIPLSL